VDPIKAAWLSLSLLALAAGSHGLLVHLALDHAQGLAEAGQTGAALRITRAVQALSPGDPEAMAERAWLELSRNDPAAREDYRRALAASPADARLWSGLALASARRGDWGGADRAYDQALARAPLQPGIAKAAGAYAFSRWLETHEPRYRQSAITRLAALLALLPGEQGPVNAWLWRESGDADLVRMANRNLCASRHLDLAGFFTSHRAYDAAIAEARLADRLSGAAPLAPEGANLLSNGGFEQSLASALRGWELMAGPGATAERDPSVSLSGRASLRIRFEGPWFAQFHHVHQLVRVAPGRKYRLEGFALDRSAPGCGRMYLAVVSDRAEGWRTVGVSEPLKVSAGWQRLEVGFQVPAGIAAVRVILHGPPDARGWPLCGTVWWDDLRLTPLPAGSEPDRARLLGEESKNHEDQLPGPEQKRGRDGKLGPAGPGTSAAGL